MTIYLVMAVVLVLAVLFLKIQFNRSVKSLIRLFRERQAVDITSAATLAELGMEKKKGIYQSLVSPRKDYRQYALQFLIHLDIIRTTVDNKLYLSEGRLSASKLDSTLHY